MARTKDETTPHQNANVDQHANRAAWYCTYNVVGAPPHTTQWLYGVHTYEPNMSIWTFFKGLFQRQAPRPRTVVSPPLPGLDASWEDKVLHTCSTGDIKAFELLIDEGDKEVNPESDPLIGRMMGYAVRWNQSEMLRYLIDRYPDFSQQPDSHGCYHISFAHEMAFRTAGRMLLYQILLERWPWLSTWELGLSGDHLGVAALHYDVPFVEWLLQHGADATQARTDGELPVSRSGTATNI